ncbi:putative plastid-lipid-associated protein 2, chloroplastic [Iris pallida]|uniref:Plastid-lipid-associated protein 2, chloroplastic n=1 Tax=Iris pallida TaxID=29817 RepID=A0AAX6EJV0_IRIPA|nr:putative plastid-lipid-associated protein 2, chloroplastic [Iris pallida]
MAGTASCNVFALKTAARIPTISPPPVRSRARRPLPCSTAFPKRSARSPPAPLLPRRSFVRRAAGAGGGEWEGQAGEELKVAEEALTETGELKKRLLDAVAGSERGLAASSERRAEIVELITQLEAKNPTPAPTEAIALLDGKWILVYTSFSQLFPLLGTGTLPHLVKVDEISQTIDSETFAVQNSVKFAGPLATAAVSTNATYEVRSPKRVQIKFKEGVIGTPQLTDSVEFPDKLEILGRSIDLSPLKGVITSIQDSYSSVAKTISGQPPLKIPISSDRAESWLLTTYLDGELRISRGDGGSVFVLVKEGSSLLN